jgi:hypothetical protein
LRLKPQVSNPVQFNNSTAINAADDTSDFLDEAGERAAFKEAVAGWRNSGSALKTDQESCDTSMKTKIRKLTAACGAIPSCQ